MNYDESLKYIHSVAWMGSRPGLSRTRELLALLENPQEGMKFLHVTGTNGKGSVCAMCASVFASSGYRTGLYTSPFIVRFNERMRVDGEEISDAELAEITTLVRPAADSMEDRPTEFELITAIAFIYFHRHNCDIVVLEVGMGGRLDSTNVISSPVASVITGVALDHTNFLGDTVEKIAFEKAGIIKQGCPTVYGGRDESAFRVIVNACAERNSTLVRTALGSLAVKKSGLFGTVFDYGAMKDIALPLLGSYQPENAATAIEAMRVCAGRGFAVSENDIRMGLAKTVWKARFELLGKDPTVIYDGSHNDQGVEAACGSIRSCFGTQKVILLMGVLADKDYRNMAGMLAPYAECVFTVRPDSTRALASDSLAEVFRSLGTEASSFPSVAEGVFSACDKAKKSGKPLVMLGSLYMYAEVSKAYFGWAQK